MYLLTKYRLQRDYRQWSLHVTLLSHRYDYLMAIKTRNIEDVAGPFESTKNICVILDQCFFQSSSERSESESDLKIVGCAYVRISLTLQPSSPSLSICLPLAIGS